MTDPWSKTVRDRWFFGALALSLVAMCWVLSPYAVVLLLSATATVVTWPVFESMRVWTGGRSGLSAVLTGLVLAIWVLAPLGALLYLFATEAIVVVQSAIELVQSGEPEAKGREWLTWFMATDVGQSVQSFLPPGMDPLSAVLDPLRDAVLVVLNKLGGALPMILNTIVGGSINSIIFVITTMVLYVEGPKILAIMRDLSPMDDRYELRLFEVFREFSQNLVVGSLATMVVQGIIATIGYWIAGLDRVIFLGTLTAVFAFVPVVGAMIVWVPVAIYVFQESGATWGIFVSLWSLLLVGTADNVLKPLFLRGSSNIHPVLIFLAVFGGLQMVGLPGALVGPVCVAFFLALYRIYREDFLGIPPPVVAPKKPGRLQRIWAKITGKKLPDPVAAPDTSADVVGPAPTGGVGAGQPGSPGVTPDGEPAPVAVPAMAPAAGTPVTPTSPTSATAPPALPRLTPTVATPAVAATPAPAPLAAGAGAAATGVGARVESAAGLVPPPAKPEPDEG